MYQLNNEEEKNIKTDGATNIDDTIIRKEQEDLEKEIKTDEKTYKTEKKNFSKNKKILIVFGIFVIVMISLTVAAIYYEKSLKAKENKTDDIKVVVDESAFKINSLTETYSSNSLVIENKKYITGPNIKTEYGVGNYNKIEVNYIQIDGLKNRTLQDNINKEIKEKAMGLYDEEKLSDNTVERVEIMSELRGNFGNTLSLYIRGLVQYKSVTKDKHNYKYVDLGPIYLNYRLDTGEYIEFEDLFLNSTRINSIIADAKYRSLAWESNEAYENDPFNLNMDIVDTSNFETKIIEFINNYKKEKNPNFCFSPNHIILKVGKEEIYINMVDIYNEIAIYKRYAGEKDLYKNNDVGVKNIFVLIDKPYNNIFEFSGDNFFVDSDISDWSDGKATPAVLKKIKDGVIIRVNNAKEQLKSNNAKAIAYKDVVLIMVDNDTNNINVVIETYINTMSIDYFKANIKELVSKRYRENNQEPMGNCINEYNNKNITTKLSNIELIYDLSGKIVPEKKEINPVNIYSE